MLCNVMFFESNMDTKHTCFILDFLNFNKISFLFNVIDPCALLTSFFVSLD